MYSRTLIHTYVRARTHARTHIQTYVLTCIHTHTRMYTHTYSSMYGARTQVFTHMRACTQTLEHVCTNTHTHTYTYTHARMRRRSLDVWMFREGKELTLVVSEVGKPIWTEYDGVCDGKWRHYDQDQWQQQPRFRHTWPRDCRHDAGAWMLECRCLFERKKKPGQCNCSLVGGEEDEEEGYNHNNEIDK